MPHARLYFCCSLLALTTPAAAATFQSLHSFTGGKDGANPFGPLIDVQGVLFGTTVYGGKADRGTVFAFTASGTETVFPLTKPQGKEASGDLLAVGGALYGTAVFDGQYKMGTVFRLTASGTLETIYSFKGGADGSYPESGLTSLGGVIYGTTGGGGTNNSGTVFTITPDGTETVLHSFGATLDGAGPSGSLVGMAGKLYGVTRSYGGAVYSITPAGVEKILYFFKGDSDGFTPSGRLLVLNGNLYGTTSQGGRGGKCRYGCGTVYQVTPGGGETILYAFQSFPDGATPVAGLVHIGSTLYGTTEFGGGKMCKGGFTQQSVT